MASDPIRDSRGRRSTPRGSASPHAVSLTGFPQDLRKSTPDHLDRLQRPAAPEPEGRSLRHLLLRLHLLQREHSTQALMGRPAMVDFTDVIMYLTSYAIATA